MPVKNAKEARSGRRWAGWDQQPLEGRALMTVAPMAHVASHVALPAASTTTFVTVANRTDLRVRIVVSDIDPDDWRGDRRPDNNLNGVVLDPGQSTTQQEQINSSTVPHFTIALDEASTGLKLVTARAAYHSVSDSALSWVLTPKSQQFVHDGKSMTFEDRGPLPNVGDFILKNTPGSR
jgi:hypothetical protein